MLGSIRQAQIRNRIMERIKINYGVGDTSQGEVVIGADEAGYTCNTIAKKAPLKKL